MREVVDENVANHDDFVDSLAAKKKLALDQRIFEIKKQKRLNITVHVILTFVLQFTLILMTFKELVTNCQYSQIIIGYVSVFIMFARFICATILHLSCVDEVSAGLEMMKYAVNHPYKFEHFSIAWLSGFLQCFSCLCVEIANIGVICGANDTISIVFNFIALAIIAEFDNYVFGSMKNESFRELTEKEFTSKVLIVCHTSSKKCPEDELSTEKDENGNFRPLKITFFSRTLPNKICFSVYKFLRTFYVSLFYYFMPFSCTLMSTVFPLFYRYYSIIELPVCD